jgi:hypothetical protein
MSAQPINIDHLFNNAMAEELGVKWLGKLGQGGFGTVFKALDIHSGQVSQGQAKAKSCGS